MTVLHTTRLRLEPLSGAHVTGLQAMNGDPEVMRYLGGLAVEAALHESTRADWLVRHRESPT